MSERISRINELLLREISVQLRKYYSTKAVRITISSVDVSPDLRIANIYYSVLGGEEDKEFSKNFLKEIRGDLQSKVSRNIILKYFPKFYFFYDGSMERGSNIINLLNELND